MTVDVPAPVAPASNRLSQRERSFAWVMLALPVLGCIFGILVASNLEPADDGSGDASIIYLLLTLMAGSFFFMPLYLPVALAAGVAARFLPRRTAILFLAGLPLVFALLIPIIAVVSGRTIDDGDFRFFLMVAGLGLFYVAIAGGLYLLARRLGWV